MTREARLVAVAARVFRDLAEEQTRLPDTCGWEIGSMPDGLPVFYGELATANPDDAMAALKLFGEDRGERHLYVDDPARIAVVFTWPEPEHGKPRPEPEAVVQLWAPALAEVRAA
ncbi:hypothetical protein ACH4GK_32135 [Streptomyces rimosus]|uniref:hypothetical protein n=1 Tax=Streptomyces rimosus TaxID=1927 RepID=UPI0004CAFC6A|nr:hypothetical protein [Streptomyces rimosus]